MVFLFDFSFSLQKIHLIGDWLNSLMWVVDQHASYCSWTKQLRSITRGGGDGVEEKQTFDSIKDHIDVYWSHKQENLNFLQWWTQTQKLGWILHALSRYEVHGQGLYHITLWKLNQAHWIWWWMELQFKKCGAFQDCKWVELLATTRLLIITN